MHPMSNILVGVWLAMLLLHGTKSTSLAGSAGMIKLRIRMEIACALVIPPMIMGRYVKNAQKIFPFGTVKSVLLAHPTLTMTSLPRPAQCALKDWSM